MNEPEEIKRIEMKMLPSPNGRDKSSCPKTVLDKQECLIYADYLDSINQPTSAEFFRK